MDDTGRIKNETTNRLILGTANFGFANEYHGCCVPKDEQDKIWDYCRQVGIDTVDTAVAYGNMEIPDDFKVITKVCKEFPKITKRYDTLLLHHIEDYKWAKKNHILLDGISIYFSVDLLDIPIRKRMIIQLPYNIVDAYLWIWTKVNWLKTLKEKGVEIHARSIFGGGELLEDYKLKDLMGFVWANQDIDKIVVGIENCQQLKEIVEIVNELE